MSTILVHVMAFPFAPLGRLIRWLSLMGGAGNVAAWVIFLAAGLLPWGVVFVLWRRRGRFWAEDGLLGVLGVMVFVVMYFMVNPGAMGGNFAMFPPEVGQMMMGGAIWSVVLAYVVVRLVRGFFGADEGKLLRYARGLLYALYVSFGLAVLSAAGALRGGGFGVVQFFHDALPFLLNIWVTFRAMGLLRAMREAPYGEEAVLAAQAMSRVCAVAITATVLVSAGFNLLQLMLSGRLQDVHIQVDFPVVSVVFLLGALLLARYLAVGKALQDENEGFI